MYDKSLAVHKNQSLVLSTAETALLPPAEEIMSKLSCSILLNPLRKHMSIFVEWINCGFSFKMDMGDGAL